LRIVFQRCDMQIKLLCCTRALLLKLADTTSY
jgi:hypothetical protein